MWPLKSNDPLWASLRAIFRTTPRGLCTDIDGTISEIAPTVDAAVIAPDMRQVLRQLTHRFDVVATISGRAVADQRRLVDLPEIWHVGHHGYEWEEYGEATSERIVTTFPNALPYLADVAAALDEIEEELAPLVPGLWMERKGITGGVHWRLAPDPHRAERIGVPAIRRIAASHGLRVRGGKLAMELLPPIITHKGDALCGLVERHNLRGVIYLGDDISDVDAFNTLRELRADGRCLGLSVGVLHQDSPKEIRASADMITEGVTGVRALLRWLGWPN